MQRMEQAEGLVQDLGLDPPCCHIPAQNSGEPKNSQFKLGLPAIVKTGTGQENKNLLFQCFVSLVSNILNIDMWVPICTPVLHYTHDSTSISLKHREPPFLKNQEWPKSE